jgi:hypothetical protein
MTRLAPIVYISKKIWQSIGANKAVSATKRQTKKSAWQVTNLLFKVEFVEW